MKITKHFLKAALMASVMAFGATAVLAQGVTIAVVGGKADDPFFAKVKKGIDDGALVVAAHGGKVNYLMLQNYDNIGGDAANLVRTAISQGASVIAVPNWVPGFRSCCTTLAVATKPKSWGPSTTSATKNIRLVWRLGPISGRITPRT